MRVVRILKYMKNTVLGSLIAALLARTVDGVWYKVIRDSQADVFENSNLPKTFLGRAVCSRHQFKGT